MIEDSASGQILEVGTAWERGLNSLRILWTWCASLALLDLDNLDRIYLLYVSSTIHMADSLIILITIAFMTAGAVRVLLQDCAGVLGLFW